MQHLEFAALLTNSSNESQGTLLRENFTLADVELAYRLKDICLEGWSTHPGQALGAAAALQSLSEIRPNAEIEALSSVGCRSQGTHRWSNATSDF